MVNKKMRWFIFLYNNVKEVCSIAEKVKKKDTIISLARNFNNLQDVTYAEYKYYLVMY
jgi:hypothetical protein